MDTFFVNFEKDCMSQFRMFDETKREEILALFTKETEERQKKLEEEALKKYEEEKRIEEAKRIEEEKKNPAAAAKGGKAPAPAAKKPPGKGEVEKPVVDVPKLEVPKIQEYTTQTGHKYLIERSIEEISQKIIDAGIQQTDGEPQVETVKSVVEAAPTGSVVTDPVSARPTEIAASVAISSVDGAPVEGGDAAAPSLKFKDNDYLVKGNMLPPRDPEGNDCLHKDLMIAKDEIMRILVQARDRCVEWLFESKT